MNVITRTKNKKLGPRTLVLDRPVGLTCPSSCPLLGTICYAERMQVRYPSTRIGAIRNLRLGATCTDPGRPLRLHVGGDFFIDGKLDRKYLSDIAHLVRSRKGGKTYTYTHCFRDPVLTRVVMRLKRFGLTVFASCHSPQDIREAVASGYRIALIANSAQEGLDALRLSGLKGIVCPEQLGTGLQCDRCGYCYLQKSQKHLILLKH